MGLRPFTAAAFTEYCYQLPTETKRDCPPARAAMSFPNPLVISQVPWPKPSSERASYHPTRPQAGPETEPTASPTRLQTHLLHRTLATQDFAPSQGSVC